MTAAVEVRNTRAKDISGIIALSRAVYPDSPPWREEQLASHLRIFPQGQFVAVDRRDGSIVGMAASVIILWDDYDIAMSWRDFTAGGTFENHDPARGRTLYGAEVMVEPGRRGEGIGKGLYRARRELTEKLGLLRIRAGARLRNYHKHADRMTAEEFVERVIRGELNDPTLSFQLALGFEVLAVVPNYLRRDPESRGYAAVIEWINAAIAKPEDYGLGDPRFRRADID